jgi:hypothetical protein
MSRSVFALIGLILIPVSGWSNGGPFFIAYPDGDNSAKGVLAVLGEHLTPHAEENLRVIGEDLTIRYRDAVEGPQHRDRGMFEIGGSHLPYFVEAKYEIENPGKRDVTAYFAFPILGGKVIQYSSMMGLSSSFHVRVEGGSPKEASAPSTESVLIREAPVFLYPVHINGLLREHAHRAIEQWIEDRESRKTRVEAVKTASGEEQAKAREAFETFLREKEGLSPTDAALFADLVALDIPLDSEPRVGFLPNPGSPDVPGVIPVAHLAMTGLFGSAEGEQKLIGRYLGPLASIGEQKGTQLWTRVASVIDPEHPYSYADFFEAWGGETREVSLDYETEKVRPRENDGSGNDLSEGVLYGRVDYLEDGNLTPETKQILERIVQNLPVIFSYTPMSLAVYRVYFPAGETRFVHVTYEQDSFVDTKDPKTYQLCYVIRTALNWDEFGKINLRVEVPGGREFVSDPPVERIGTKGPAILYEAELTSYEKNLRIAVKESEEPKVQTGKATRQGGRRGG